MRRSRSAGPARLTTSSRTRRSIRHRRGVVERLKARSLIEVAHDPSDGRKLLVCATAAGLALIAHTVAVRRRRDRTDLRQPEPRRANWLSCSCCARCWHSKTYPCLALCNVSHYSHAFALRLNAAAGAAARCASSSVAQDRLGREGRGVESAPLWHHTARLAIAQGPGTEADSPAPSGGSPCRGINTTSIGGSSANVKIG